MIKDPTAIFNDIDIPYVLTQVRAYFPDGCSTALVVTASWSVIIDDTTFYATSDIITFTNPLTEPIFITRTYNGATITSLTPGQPVTFVLPPKIQN